MEKNFAWNTHFFLYDLLRFYMYLHLLKVQNCCKVNCSVVLLHWLRNYFSVLYQTCIILKNFKIKTVDHGLFIVTC